jgi:membrane protease YdiL (CAAX protease family)
MTRRSRPLPAAPDGRLAAVLGVLVTANVANNRLLPRCYVLTGMAASILLGVLARRDGCSWTDLGLSRRRVRPGLWWGAVTAAAVALGYAVAVALPPTRSGFDDARSTALSGSQLAWRAFGTVPLGTVLLEEVAFRGVLYAMLTRRYGLRPAIMTSSVLFGLWHFLPAQAVRGSNAFVGQVAGTGSGAQALTVLGAMIGAAVGGVVLCELRRRSGSLLAPAILHWALNGLGYAFAWWMWRVER